MKIIIVGAGIGGLTSYIALQKLLADLPPDLQPTIQIYEAHANPTLTTSTIGGGLGLGPNGLRALARLCPAAVERIQANGFTSQFLTLRNSKGWHVGRVWTGKGGKYGYPQIMLSRQTAHEAILAEVPPGVVQWGKRVKTVRETDAAVEVEFEDGQLETADLVIGADGVKSLVREAIVGPGYSPLYEGLTGVGGFLPLSSISPELRNSLNEEPVTMTFGPDGFFGYGACTPLDERPGQQPRIMWWSTYQIDTPPPRNAPIADLRAQLLARHESWRSPYDTPSTPVFSSLIQLGCPLVAAAADTGASQSATSKDSAILVLPTYITPRLPHWATPSGRIVCLGDAAHAMPPHAGQGVSAAVEDSLTLALLLRHFLGRQPADNGKLDLADVLRSVAGGYEHIRIPSVNAILERAKYAGDAKRTKKWWQEHLRDFMIWVLCKLPESVLHGSVFGYDVDVEVQKYLRNL